jgi:ribonuclease HII
VRLLFIFSHVQIEVMTTCPSLDYEKMYWKRSEQVAGVDEVGRGAVAGPVVAAAVRFTANHQVIPGIHDSKLLSAAKREALMLPIIDQAESWGIGIGPIEMINAKGIMPATVEAMRQAIVAAGLADIVLVDGLAHPLMQPAFGCRIQTVVGGDRKVYSIAAASILAKVFRDRLMCHLHRLFPDYHFDCNKGYGTQAHRHGFDAFGKTSQHRSLFVRKWL